jgi:hypothetical protein
MHFGNSSSSGVACPRHLSNFIYINMLASLGAHPATHVRVLAGFLQHVSTLHC